MENEEWCPRRRTENWVLRETRAVIFNDVEAVFIYLNETGTDIWLLCEGKYTVQDIVKKIAERYEIPSPELVKKDLEEFLEILKKQYLVI